MGFKLGTNRGLEATGGEIKTKMRFGKQSGGDGSVPGTPVIRVPLDEGVMGDIEMGEFEISFISTIFGAMSAKVNTVVDFFFGGSSKKNEQQQQIKNK